MGTVAVDPKIFGIPFPEATPGQGLTPGQVAQRSDSRRILAAAARAIRISPQGLRVENGPAPPYSVSDIGDRNIRNSQIPRFDIYRFNTLQAAIQFGRQDVVTDITIPGYLSCPPGFFEVP